MQQIATVLQSLIIPPHFLIFFLKAIYHRTFYVREIHAHLLELIRALAAQVLRVAGVLNAQLVQLAVEQLQNDLSSKM